MLRSHLMLLQLVLSTGISTQIIFGAKAVRKALFPFSSSDQYNFPGWNPRTSPLFSLLSASGCFSAFPAGTRSVWGEFSSKWRSRLAETRIYFPFSLSSFLVVKYFSMKIFMKLCRNFHRRLNNFTEAVLKFLKSVCSAFDPTEFIA